MPSINPCTLTYSGAAWMNVRISIQMPEASSKDP
jgi:hypothetical protein